MHWQPAADIRLPQPPEEQLVPVFTLIDQGRPLVVDASPGPGTLVISPAALHEALGWELKPEGICQGDVCVPIPPSSNVVRDGEIDLVAFAGLLHRPLALDLEEHAAFLGAAAEDRTAQITSLEAPDFTLPDLQGRPHSLSDYRGQKVFLVAYASW